MENESSTWGVVEEIYESIAATGQRQRKLLSKTFWERFGVQKRTPKIIQEIEDALAHRGIKVALKDSEFGKEGRNVWIFLSVELPDRPVVVVSPDTTLPVARPEESWFEAMSKREFESEREIETYFIIPLLDKLGYQEDNIHMGCPVTMYQGVKAIQKQADVVTFADNKRGKENALLVIEAKLFGKLISEGCIGQARSYAINLTTPFYLITNAVEIHLYQNLNGQYPDPLMKLECSQLRENWNALYARVNKAAVTEHKKKIGVLLTT